LNTEHFRYGGEWVSLADTENVARVLVDVAAKLCA